MKRFSFFLLFLLYLFSTSSTHAFQKDKYLCREKATGQEILDIQLKKNRYRYGSPRQFIHVKKNFYVDDSIVRAGSKFYSDDIPLHINLDNCGEGSFLGVIGLGKAESELVFLCDMNSGPQYTVFISALVCQ